MNDFVLYSIHRVHNEKIFNGEKTLEIRKNAPKCDYPHTGLIYEPKSGGGCGAVVGYFKCDFRIKTNAFALEDTPALDSYKNHIAKCACLTLDELYTYANGKAIHGLGVCDAIRFPSPRPLSDFGVKRAPQSWQYINLIK